MNRVPLIVIACLALVGCSATTSELVVAGTVDARLESVAVPTLNLPKVNLDAGFETSGQSGGASSNTGTTYGLGSFVKIDELRVAEGDTVRAGQVLGSVDSAALEAQVATAEADADVAASQVGLLAKAIDEAKDKAAEVAESKADVKKAINTLNKTRAKLVKTRKLLKKQRPALAKKLKQAQQLLANYPPVPVPGVPSKAELEKGIAKMKAGLKKMDAGLKQINKAIPKLDKGLKKARDGLEKLDDAAAEITDARAQLADLKELAEIAAEAMQVPIDQANLQLSLAQLTAPVDGVVVGAAAAGDLLAPGASVVSIRPDGPSKVTAWLSPAQMAQVCVGDAASITSDWNSVGVPATLTTIATRAEYPPTSVPTEEVHLTRAIEVEFTATEQLPAGVPVEISINGCRPSADRTEEDTDGRP